MTSTQTHVEEIRRLYLDVIKRTLTGALAEDNDSILGGVRWQGNPSLTKRIAGALGEIAGKFNVEIAIKKPYDARLRETGRDWPSRAESMIGLKRMTNIEECVESIVLGDVPGDLIETGVWRGGASIFMKANLKAWGDTKRVVWVADSFEGLPAPDESQYPADAGDRNHELGGLAVGAHVVRHNFERFSLLDERVQFLVGWFKDTLPTAPIEALSMMRLDGDMYESTIQALESLYPKLSPGGFCIVDDYGSHASQAGQAVRDYRQAHDIDEEIFDIDGSGAYWRRRS